MKIVRDKRLRRWTVDGGGGGGEGGVDGRGRGAKEVGRGRPRTRRIIARVILPRCAGSPFLSLSFRLAPLPRAFCLALMRAYVHASTYVHAS